MKAIARYYLVFLAIHISVSAQDKHGLFTEILHDNIKEGLVKYNNLVNDSRLNEYLNQLSKSDPDKIKDDNDRLAFWINVYNAFTLKVIVDNYPVESINDLHKGGLVLGQVLGTTIWHHEFININMQTYSLNDIEHDIIRKEFNEPRIHFTLVCAAISCPPLRNEAYEGYKLDQQLNDQSVAFFNDTKKNNFNYEKKIAGLSKLLDWYAEDFGESDEVILRYISRFLADSLQTKIIINIDDWEIEYISYDWALNEYKSDTKK